MTRLEFQQALTNYLAWMKPVAKRMRLVSLIGLAIGVPAQIFGIFERYPVPAFSIGGAVLLFIFIEALRIDSKEKTFGLVCPKCGLRLSRAAAPKVLATAQCPRCKVPIIA